MKRTVRIILWVFGGLVVLLGLACAAVYVFATSDYVRAQIENHANAYSGRKTTIGRVVVAWSWTPHVELDNVQISNTDWGKAPHMFTAQQIDFAIRILPLLRGDFVLPELILRKPELALERGTQDQSNWSAAQSPVAAGAVDVVTPRERHQTPLIGRLEIDDGHISYADAKRNLQLNGTVQTALGRAGGQPRAEFKLQGRLEGEPLSLQFQGGSMLLLRDTDRPYPIDLSVSYGQTKLTVKGQLQDPIQWKGADVRLTLSGDDLSQIYPLLGIPGPPTPPYRIAGKLDYENGVWRVDDMAMHAGDSDLSGSVTIDQRETPSRLTAKLVSQHLTFADLAPLVGATPGRRTNVSPQQKQTEEQLEAREDLFPNVPLHTERLRAMNMDVSLDAKHVIAPPHVPVDAIDARVQVSNGVAHVQPFTMGFGGGTVSGEFSIDAHADTPETRANLQYRAVELAQFFRGSRYFDTTEGKLQGRIVFAGTGHSLAKVMGSANGEISVAMQGGSISSFLISLAGLQIGDALVLYITGDDRIPIRCALGRLTLADGTATFDRTIIDTQKSVLHINGHASLQSQALDSKVTADIKQFNLLDLHGPVVIEGKIRDPKFSIARVIPIPTPDLGTAKDIDCPALTQALLSAPPPRAQPGNAQPGTAQPGTARQ